MRFLRLILLQQFLKLMTLGVTCNWFLLYTSLSAWQKKKSIRILMILARQGKKDILIDIGRRGGVSICQNVKKSFYITAALMKR